MLYRGANILILDEPTAVLTPQETEKLFASAAQHARRGQGHHHHHPQAATRCWRCPTALPYCARAQYIGTVETKDADEAQPDRNDGGQEGRRWTSSARAARTRIRRLDVHHVNCRKSTRARQVLERRRPSSAYSGEILGIAGIAGSGQKELLEAIAGLQPLTERPHPCIATARVTSRN